MIHKKELKWFTSERIIYNNKRNDITYIKDEQPSKKCRYIYEKHRHITQTPTTI